MVLICGIPNAGKTTLSRQYRNVVHYDYVGGGSRRREMIADMVRDDNTICVEGVYERASSRRMLVEASPNERNTCIWMDTPLDLCVERELNGRKRSVTMVRMAHEDFEPPTYDEGWDEIIVMRPEDKERDNDEAHL